MRLIFLVIILLPAVHAYSQTLYVAVIGKSLKTTSTKYFETMGTVMSEYDDRLIIIDSSTSNIILEISKSDIDNLDNPARLATGINELLKELDSRYIRKNRLAFEKLNVISSGSKYLSRPGRILNMIPNIKAAYSDFDVIKIDLLDDSFVFYQGHKSFLIGYPTYGFVVLDESPFKFDTIKIKGVEVNVFYNNEPESNTEILEFYDLVLFNAYGFKVNSFGGALTYGSRPPEITVEKSALIGVHPKKLNILSEEITGPCDTDDEVSVDISDKSHEVIVSLDNLCRKGGFLVSFKLKNSKGELQKRPSTDKFGRASVIFPLTPGKNIVSYKNLLGVYVAIFEQEVKGGTDDVKIQEEFDIRKITIIGENKFRNDGEYVEIIYKNTGRATRSVVRNGRYEKQFDVRKGLNTFIIKQMDGTKLVKEINFSTECDDDITINQQRLQNDGDLIARLKNACREEGSLVTFIYDGKEFYGKIDNGQAEITFPLYKKINDIYYISHERVRKLLGQYEIKKFQKLIKISIFWNDPAFLDLHVFEPGFPIEFPVEADKYSSADGQPTMDGHIQYSNPKSGIGKLTIDKIPSSHEVESKVSSSYTLSYTAMYAPSLEGKLYVYVDNFNRHGTYGGFDKHCNSRARGGVSFQYKALIKGTLTTGELFINPAICSKDLDKSSAATILFTDKKSKLFKKVLYSQF